MSNKSLPGLISFINDIKPYHSKIFEVTEEYIFSDIMNVNACDDLEMGITFVNEPLCQPVGFGLIFDGKCGFDALMCCDLFDCDAYDVIYDNDILVQAPIEQFDPIGGEIRVTGDVRHDTYFQIKSIPNSSTIIVNNDVTALLANHSYLLIAPTHTFDIISMSSNGVTIAGDATWLLKQQSEIVIEHSSHSDGRFVIATIHFDGLNTIITVSSGFIPSPTVLGTARIFKVCPNRGLYEIASTTFNGAETLITVANSNLLDIVDSVPYVKHGSVVIRTGFNIDRKVFIYNSDGVDAFYRIHHVSYDVGSDSSVVALDGCMGYVDLSGAFAQLVGYAPMYDAKSCGIPKAPHVQTHFSESLVIYPVT